MKNKNILFLTFIIVGLYSSQADAMLTNFVKGAFSAVSGSISRMSSINSGRLFTRTRYTKKHSTSRNSKKRPFSNVASWFNNGKRQSQSNNSTKRNWKSFFFNKSSQQPITSKFNQPINPLLAFFFGLSISYNEEENKVFIGAGDLHRYHEKQHNQQQELIKVVKKLQNKGEKVLVIVEDTDSALKKYHSKQWSFFRWSFFEPIPSSPLTGLEELCKQHNINVINVEFRYLKQINQADFDREKRLIENNTDPIIMKALSKYHEEGYCDSEFVDANIINAIKSNNASIIIVCAGGGHIDSIANVLYNHLDYKSHINFPFEDTYDVNYNHDKPLFGINPLLTMDIEGIQNVKQNIKKAQELRHYTLNRDYELLMMDY